MNKRNTNNFRKNVAKKNANKPATKSTQKTYTIDNREAVAMIDYMGQVMTLNLISYSNVGSDTIQKQVTSLTQQAGAIFLKFGYKALQTLVVMFIDDQNEKGKRVGKKLILPEYYFMNKSMEMVDIKQVIFS